MACTPDIGHFLWVKEYLQKVAGLVPKKISCKMVLEEEEEEEEGEEEEEERLRR